MYRNADRFNDSVAFHYKMQLDHFENERERQVDNMIEWANKHENDKALRVWRQIDKMKFIFDKSVCKINYGTCTKYNKPVSFVPNTIQLETQECFKHRKDE